MKIFANKIKCDITIIAITIIGFSILTKNPAITKIAIATRQDTAIIANIFFFMTLKFKV